MDTKTLFHDPDDLSDEELKSLRFKLTTQRQMPYFAAAFTAMSFHVLHSQMFRTGVLPVRITIAAAAGFMLGGYGAHSVNGSILPRKFDKDIMLAFEQRFLKHSLNVAGYNNNSISLRNNFDYAGQVKPY